MHFLPELPALATQNELTHGLRKRWISVSDILLPAHHQHQNHWTWKRKQQIQSNPSTIFYTSIDTDSIQLDWTRLEGSLQLAAGIVYLTILEIFGCSVHHQPRSQKTTNPVDTTKFIIPYQKQIPSIINNERAIKYSV